MSCPLLDLIHRLGRTVARAFDGGPWSPHRTVGARRLVGGPWSWGGRPGRSLGEGDGRDWTAVRVCGREPIMTELQRPPAAGVDVVVSTTPGSRAQWRDAGWSWWASGRQTWWAPVAPRPGVRRGRRSVRISRGSNGACVGVERALVLPNRRGRAGRRTQRGGGGRPNDGRIVAVTGARGGAGASVFAVALALAAQRSPGTAATPTRVRGAGCAVGHGVRFRRRLNGVAPAGRLPAGTLLRALPSGGGSVGVVSRHSCATP